MLTKDYRHKIDSGKAWAGASLSSPHERAHYFKVANVVRFFSWLWNLIFGRPTAPTAAQSKTGPVAPLRQDDRDKAIVMRISDEESSDDNKEIKPTHRHETEAFPLPTFTAHHHHF